MHFHIVLLISYSVTFKIFSGNLLDGKKDITKQKGQLNIPSIYNFYCTLEQEGTQSWKNYSCMFENCRDPEDHHLKFSEQEQSDCNT